MPGWLEVNLPQEVRDEVLESIEVKERNMGNSLAGVISEEYMINGGPKLKYITESLCEEFFNVFDLPYPETIEGFDKPKYKTGAMWVNYQRKGDYNPSHVHNGDFSFVVWVKLPDLSNEPDLAPHKKETIGEFSFTPIMSYPYSSPLPIAEEWKLVVFPSDLIHTVYPFFNSDDTRISVAGNLYLFR